MKEIYKVLCTATIPAMSDGMLGTSAAICCSGPGCRALHTGHRDYSLLSGMVTTVKVLFLLIISYDSDENL